MEENNQANNRQNAFWTEETFELQIEKISHIPERTNKKKTYFYMYSSKLFWIPKMR